MFRINNIIIILFIFIGKLVSQPNQLEELHKPIRNLVITDPMLAYDQAKEEIQYGLKLKNPLRVGLGHLIIGNVKWILGEFPVALESYYTALGVFEQENDLYGRITTYNDISLVYLDEQNYKESLHNLRKAYHLNELFGNLWLRTIIESNIGDVFLKADQLDSADYYTGRSYESALEVGDASLYPFILLNMGKIQLAKNNPNSAKMFLKNGIEIARNIEDKTHTGLLLLSLGDLHLGDQQLDSAYTFYHQAMLYGKLIESKYEILSAAKKLQAYHQIQSKYDSAYAYSVLAQNLQDSLLGAEKVRMITQRQHLEEIRQKELLEAREKEEIAREHLTQYILIIILMLMLTGLAFILRKAHVNSYWLEFYLVVLLLFVFEFLTLVAHSIFGELTHHSPSLMLFLLILFAALLSPLHHHSKNFGKKLLGIKT